MTKLSKTRLSFFVVLFAVCLAGPVASHFLLNLNVRIFHVAHQSDGLTIHMRTPMPYLVADKVGEQSGDDLPLPAPYTTNQMQDGRIVHFVDMDEFTANPLGLGDIAADGLHIEVNGARLLGTVEAVVLHKVGTEPGFATLSEATSVFDAPRELTFRDPVYVGDAVLDIQISYETDAAFSAYSISSRLDPGLPGQEQTANLILDYGPGEPKVFRSRGLMKDAIEISRSRLQAFKTFVFEGVMHIIEGVDHVLFVICLVLGAHSLGNLLSRVTGFTIGHSVTLAIGFFGFVPSASWFIPAVETGIAVSIIYAAAIAMWPRSKYQSNSISIFFVAVSIGLLHGLGFSFVLHEILKVDSPNIWQSLLAFNVGVEIGQIIIVAAVYPLVYLLPRLNPSVWSAVRGVTAAACFGIAGVWTVERGSQTMSAVKDETEASVVQFGSTVPISEEPLD